MHIVSFVSKVAGGVATRSARAVALLVAATIAQPAFAVPQEAAGPTATPSPDTPTGILLTLKQLTVTIDPEGDAKANGDKVAAFQSATLGIFSCDDVAGVAQSTGATVKDADNVPLGALPPPLRAVVATMKVGTATQLFGDRAAGQVKVLVLCARR